MEVIKNEAPETIQEEKQEPMSEFCEGLMGRTDELKELMRSEDCAIVICGDGKTVSARSRGIYPNMLNMLYSIMKNDESYAELITEAAMLYSHDMLGRRVAKKIDKCN
jgi:hypothetical protein